jgi:hypothetical protein
VDLAYGILPSLSKESLANRIDKNEQTKDYDNQHAKQILFHKSKNCTQDSTQFLPALANPVELLFHYLVRVKAIFHTIIP